MVVFQTANNSLISFLVNAMYKIAFQKSLQLLV